MDDDSDGEADIASDNTIYLSAYAERTAGGTADISGQTVYIAGSRTYFYKKGKHGYTRHSV